MEEDHNDVHVEGLEFGETPVHIEEDEREMNERIDEDTRLWQLGDRVNYVTAELLSDPPNYTKITDAIDYIKSERGFLSALLGRGDYYDTLYSRVLTYMLELADAPSIECIRWVDAFLAEHADLLVKEAVDGAHIHLTIRAAHLLVKSESAVAQDKGRQIFDRGREELLKLLEDDRNGILPNISHILYEQYPESRDKIISLCKEKLNSEQGDTREEGAWMFGLLYKNGGELAREGVEKFCVLHLMQSAVLSQEKAAKIFAAWVAVGHLEYKLGANFEVIRALESEKPGSASFLHDSYGITFFGRYPISLLLKQYDAETDAETPYGIAILPYSDWNGAFYGTRSLFEQMQEQLGEHVLLRCAEAKTSTGLLRHVIGFYRKFGKITFALLGGHGQTDAIQFGDASHGQRSALKIEDLAGSGSERAQKYFAEHPTIILSSCSTGAEGGIGQKLSEKLGAIVLAPAVPTAPINIDIIGAETNNLAFKITYQNEGVAREYIQGREQPL